MLSSIDKVTRRLFSGDGGCDGGVLGLWMEGVGVRFRFWQHGSMADDLLRLNIFNACT